MALLEISRFKYLFLKTEVLLSHICCDSMAGSLPGESLALTHRRLGSTDVSRWETWIPL